jgi:predicted nuclease with TOPRIM domain
MADIQEIFKRINEMKKKQKDIRSVYKDALDTSLEYKEINEKMTTLRVKKKQIEESTKQNFASELTKLDDLAIDIAGDVELLNDAALTKLMKGETVEVTDEYDNKYEPLFSVKFKKT